MFVPKKLEIIDKKEVLKFFKGISNSLNDTANGVKELGTKPSYPFILAMHDLDFRVFHNGMLIRRGIEEICVSGGARVYEEELRILKKIKRIIDMFDKMIKKITEENVNYCRHTLYNWIKHYARETEQYIENNTRRKEEEIQIDDFCH